jgi:hypothetical protein
MMVRETWVEKIENALREGCDEAADELVTQIAYRAENGLTDMRDIAMCLVAINDTLGYIRGTIESAARSVIDA